MNRNKLSISNILYIIYIYKQTCLSVCLSVRSIGAQAKKNSEMVSSQELQGVTSFRLLRGWGL